MNKIEGFTINLYKDGDGDWLAHFVELPNVSAFSDTPEGALNELRTAWEGIKESYRKHNQPIPYPQSDNQYAGFIAPIPAIPALIPQQNSAL